MTFVKGVYKYKVLQIGIMTMIDESQKRQKPLYGKNRFTPDVKMRTWSKNLFFDIEQGIKFQL